MPYAPQPGSALSALQSVRYSSPHLARLLRPDLYPGEQSFFAGNPQVAGMAAEDNRVVLNPALSDPAARKSVFLNEAARLFMRQNGTPQVEVTPAQRQRFAGTPYETAAPDDLRATILARRLSGDPSAGETTPEQNAAAGRLTRDLFRWRPE